MNIAPVGKIGLVSGIGRVFGYSGAILALYLFKPLVLKSGYKATFFPTGLLFFIFALPCMIFVKDKTQDPSPLSYPLKDGRPVRSKFILGLFRPPSPEGLSAAVGGLSDFLKASFFGLCAVNTIILFMSVYATKALLLSETQILKLITFSTFFAITGSFISGYISDFLGSKTSLITAFVLWAIGIVPAALTVNPKLYWIIGALVGLAFGSTWTVSRAFVVRLVPVQRMGEVFGVFNFVGYLSAITGAFFWGLILLLLAPLGQIGYRIALLSLNVFFVLGVVFLLRIPQHKLYTLDNT